MPTQEDVVRIASCLAGAVPNPTRFGFSVSVKGKLKGFVWVWLERVDPKKGRVPNPAVIAVRVPDLGTKEMLLSSGRPGLFTEPHYDGYPAVLVRLGDVDMDELEDLIVESWRRQAPADAVRAFDEGRG